jgi:signal transduction histidine kinase
VLPPVSDQTVAALAEPKVIGNHVLNNLLSNAIKFSYPDSTIEVNVDNRESEVVISVTDHGVGIPQDLIKRLFDPFSRTTRRGTNGEPGTGFGMLTVKSFVDMFGGRIEVSSKTIDDSPTDHGTTVSVILRKAAGRSG